MKPKPKKSRRQPATKKSSTRVPFMDQAAAAIEKYDLSEEHQGSVNALIGRGRRTRTPLCSDAAVMSITRQRLAEAITEWLDAHPDRELIRVEVNETAGETSLECPAVSRKAVVDRLVGLIPRGPSIAAFCPRIIVPDGELDEGRLVLLGRALTFCPKEDANEMRERLIHGRAVRNRLQLPPVRVMKASAGVTAAVDWLLPDANSSWRLETEPSGEVRLVEDDLKPLHALRLAELWVQTPLTRLLRGVGEGTRIVTAVRTKVNAFVRSRSDSSLLPRDPNPWTVWGSLPHNREDGRLPMLLDSQFDVPPLKRRSVRKAIKVRPGFPPRPGSKKNKKRGTRLAPKL